MEAKLLSLGTATPEYCIPQDQAAEIMIRLLPADPTDLRKLYRNSGIQKRYTVLQDFLKPESSPFLKRLFSQSNQAGMKERNDIFLREAPKLAHLAAERAIEDWGGKKETITHIISITCTGTITPGIEFHLINSLGLNRSVSRLGLNFMGCFGALKGLSVAQAMAKSDPNHRVLVVCTELCSLHMQSDLQPDTLVGNALFGDASAAAIVGCEENALWEIARFHSCALTDTLHHMSWNAGDTGLTLTLSKEIPLLIYEQIEPFIKALIGESQTDRDWAVHPGGKAILKAVEKRMGIDKKQTWASWDVLSEYGNCSSPTFLFILDKIRKQGNISGECIGLGFGPGLSMEGVLLKK